MGEVQAGIDVGVRGGLVEIGRVVVVSARGIQLCLHCFVFSLMYCDVSLSYLHCQSCQLPRSNAVNVVAEVEAVELTGQGDKVRIIELDFSMCKMISM